MFFNRKVSSLKLGMTDVFFPSSLRKILSTVGIFLNITDVDASNDSYFSDLLLVLPELH